MKISLTPSQLWQLLSYDDLFDSVLLTRYPWLVEELKAVAPKTLWQEHNLYLHLANPSLPELFSTQGWKEAVRLGRLTNENNRRQRDIPTESSKETRRETSTVSNGNVDGCTTASLPPNNEHDRMARNLLATKVKEVLVAKGIDRELAEAVLKKATAEKLQQLAVKYGVTL